MTDEANTKPAKSNQELRDDYVVLFNKRAALDFEITQIESEIKERGFNHVFVQSFPGY